MPGLTGTTAQRAQKKMARVRRVMPSEGIETPEAILAAPENYKVILENDAVQVLDVTIRKGEVTPMHSHPFPYVAYVVSSCKVKFTSANGQTECLGSA